MPKRIQGPHPHQHCLKLTVGQDMVFEVKGGHNIFGGIKNANGVYVYYQEKEKRKKKYKSKPLEKKQMAHNEMQELATQEQVDYILDYIIEAIKKNEVFLATKSQMSSMLSRRLIR